jgi:hypothetical protein
VPQHPSRFLLRFGSFIHKLNIYIFVIETLVRNPTLAPISRTITGVGFGRGVTLPPLITTTLPYSSDSLTPDVSQAHLRKPILLPLPIASAVMPSNEKSIAVGGPMDEASLGLEAGASVEALTRPTNSRGSLMVQSQVKDHVKASNEDELDNLSFLDKNMTSNDGVVAIKRSSGCKIS